MELPTTNRKRRPAVMAGRFYPESPEDCREAVQQMSIIPEAIESQLDGKLIHGGLVPHAGWVCSGRIAGMTIAAMKQRSEARTVFLTGSVHTVQLNQPALDDSDYWQTPIGDVPVDTELRDTLTWLNDFEIIDVAHEREHALEVVLPFLQVAFGEELRIVPCMIPPARRAEQWGRDLGELISNWPEPVLIVVSSDLTHYGADFGLTVAGSTSAGIQWAHEVNDQMVLDQVTAMSPESVVTTCQQYQCACGGGAIAAGMAAAKVLGARQGILLEHTNSAKELSKLGSTHHASSVGYAGAVFSE